MTDSMDIVIIGAVMSWDRMQGQRGTQLADEFLKMGHHVLYVEIDRSSNQTAYNAKTFRLVHVLPRSWTQYKSSRKIDRKVNRILQKAQRAAAFAARTKLGAAVFALLPSPLKYRAGEFIEETTTVEVDQDLPVIRRRLADAVEVFCRSRSRRLAIFEIPMRCYVECVDILKDRGFKVIYDFIDKWELMWGGDKIRQPDDERKLVDLADNITVTSKYLMKEFLGLYPWRTDALYVPNAVDRTKFSVSSVKTRPIYMGRDAVAVGYFGSIGEWFDWRLLEFLADKRTKWKFYLIGQYAERREFPSEAWQRLVAKPNVAALGRRDHSELINYLAEWDICIIPFLDTPVTRATSPVKLFEYLSAYKPVVATYSRELEGIPYVYLAKDYSEFLRKCDESLTKPVNRKTIDQFLQRNTWNARARAIVDSWKCYRRGEAVTWECREVRKVWANTLCSIIVLSLNTKEVTRQALESIVYHSDSPYELIVVDNGSVDGSREMLQQMKREGMIHKLVLSDRNLGYAGGNNRGMALASGDIIIFANSDIVVSPKWLSGIIRAFSNPEIGAVGPVSNNVGSVNFPQRVKYQNQKAGQLIELRRISGFCVAISRECLDKVGVWDEDFYPGNFDDDDMSVRIIRNGFRIICTGDVFVHHRLNETYRANPGLELDKTFWDNKRKFERKWPEESSVISYTPELW